MPFHEDFHEFEKRMACEHVVRSVRVPGRSQVRQYLFANGAVSDGNWNHSDPPADPGRLARLKRDYWKEMYDQETAKFNTYRRGVLQAIEYHKSFPNAYAPPPADAPKILADSLRVIEQLLQRLDAAEKEVMNLPEEREKREREQLIREMERAEADRVSNLIREIEGLELRSRPA